MLVFCYSKLVLDILLALDYILGVLVFIFFQGFGGILLLVIETADITA